MSSIALYDIIADVGLVIKITRYVRANRISENLVGQAAICFGVCLDSGLEFWIHDLNLEFNAVTLKLIPEPD